MHKPNVQYKDRTEKSCTSYCPTVVEFAFYMVVVTVVVTGQGEQPYKKVLAFTKAFVSCKEPFFPSRHISSGFNESRESLTLGW